MTLANNDQTTDIASKKDDKQRLQNTGSTLLCIEIKISQMMHRQHILTQNESKGAFLRKKNKLSVDEIRSSNFKVVSSIRCLINHTKLVNIRRFIKSPLNFTRTVRIFSSPFQDMC